MNNMKQKVKSLIFILVLLVGICIVVICLNKKPQVTDADTQTTDTTQAIDSKPQAIDSLESYDFNFKGFEKTEILEVPKKGDSRFFEKMFKDGKIGNFSLFRNELSLDEIFEKPDIIAIKKGDYYQNFFEVEIGLEYEDATEGKMLLMTRKKDLDYQVLYLRTEETTIPIDTLKGNCIEYLYDPSFIGSGDSIICYCSEMGDEDDDFYNGERDIILYIKQGENYIKKVFNRKNFNEYIKAKYTTEYKWIRETHQAYMVYENKKSGRELVSKDIEPLVESDDKRYFLGKKCVYCKDVLVLVDLEKMETSYILDIDCNKDFFYDTERKCFAYDEGPSVCYITKVNIEPISTLYDPYPLKGKSCEEYWNLIKNKYGLNFEIKLN